MCYVIVPVMVVSDQIKSIALEKSKKPIASLKWKVVKIVDIIDTYRVNKSTGKTTISQYLNQQHNQIQQSPDHDHLITIYGWIKSVRVQGGGRFAFVQVNDGSCKSNIQIVVNSDAYGFDSISASGVGSSVMITGKLVLRPDRDLKSGKDSFETYEQISERIELQVNNEESHAAVVIGANTNQSKYPLAKKSHSKEFLREIAHLRPRSYYISAIMRVRNALALSTHLFFQQKGFFYINGPIITGADCEGAGELFKVTTLESGEDVKKDFFGKNAYLSCSAQLSAEACACAVGNVYTFGPTFRAEKSHTSRHLAEFWMVEPEIAFLDLEGIMCMAEEYIKFCIKFALDHCYDDILYFQEFVEKGLVERLENVIGNEFARLSYTDAVEILIQCQESNSEFKFANPVSWGIDLQSEHERFITEQIFGRPVILYNYPKDIKAFYMRLNDDGKTVAAMDVLVPKIGELVGGSQREERLDYLLKQYEDHKLDSKPYWWYNELRSYGTVPHAGFGLGFERLVMMVTGVDNIRDVILFPRYPGHVEF
ncbi:asparaginyl-tRNA synthetase [Babesia microti strain RI]|uniref:asparagine--tRNA ligase n=1 Tax=Babesia microti (strain RI) TaxID=1133968 RepID=I7I9X6_BABMR|nr:asparaginyl-tRNA synthetase [Babesia microti strain RI]CCF75804.1 asparaginyl-tRNA synthetase [Babesia microti strain RI]|eukprot:XP_012650212.1 asparaginyl-tRNA synthetase [Babesia microti strain RI]